MKHNTSKSWLLHRHSSAQWLLGGFIWALTAQILSKYVDFREALDTVSHDLLLNKVKRYRISQTYVKILTNYLSNRQQETVVNNSISSLKSVPYGVPQGSVLGPTLFLLYINDIVKVIKKSSCNWYADNMDIFNSLKKHGKPVRITKRSR